MQGCARIDCPDFPRLWEFPVLIPVLRYAHLSIPILCRLAGGSLYVPRSHARYVPLSVFGGSSLTFSADWWSTGKLYTYHFVPCPGVQYAI
jgi:hypothetical protein